ncbi:MAG: 16S rRNA (adenine(1518)-N(6)/adenine(1519)-N(6))-dimethyltransferase RsmA [Nitrospirota bacterium]|nr:16S rRNA (adenine(1518)-N(6)/adenine(1519)-N(6))-dimethyltransferase RsmA [Nitrospirota bacterium]
MKHLSLPRPRKRWGQHFLIDPNIIRKIVAIAQISSDDTVFEIGPGRGALTRPLCEQAGRVIAVELDPKLVEYLPESCSNYHNLDLHTGDAMVFPVELLPAKTIVVANLPYYLSTPLLFRLFEARSVIQRMVVLLQREVARRIVAKAATRDYGTLSVLSQYYSDPVIAFSIPGTCFTPRPDVDSAVVCLPIRPDRISQGCDAFFQNTVRAAFAHRRKTLANSFRDEGWEMRRIGQALEHVKILPSRRAESVTVGEFESLAQALQHWEP